MSATFPLIANVAIALTVAVIGGWLASSLRQSPILGYLLAGVIIGPFTPGFVGDQQEIAALADVGVVFLMFALGVAFSIKDLARIRNVAIIGAVIQVILTVLFGWAVSYWSGWPLLESVLLGGALAASSSMVILKTLLDRGEIASGHGRLLLAMSIVQDLLVVILIVLLPKLAGADPDASATDTIMDIGITLIKAIVFIAVSLTLGLRAVPWVMRRVTQLRSSELFIVTAAVFALGAASVSSVLGLSAALGAFLAGLVLSESEFDHRVIAEVVPVRDLFATLFFVSVGMLIDLSFILNNWQVVLLAAFAVIVIKTGATLLAVLPFKLTPRTAAFTVLGMAPIGELNFVLAQAGLQAGIVSTHSYKLILATALITIVLTPAAFAAAPSVARAFSAIPGLRRCFDAHSQLGGANATLEQHGVIIGYGRVGHSVARGLIRAGMPVAVVDARLSRVREGMADGFPSVYGSAISPTVLKAAHLETARLVFVALTDFGPTRATVKQIRAINPRIVIAARAENSKDEPALRDAGADLVIVPELEGANALLQGALDLIHMPR